MGKRDPEDWVLGNGTTSIITLPTSLQSYKVETDHEGFPRGHGITFTPLSTEFAAAPNFRRFYRDFHFDVFTEINPPPLPLPFRQTPIAAVASGASGASKAGSKGTEGAKSKQGAVLAPGWIVWTGNEAC